MSAASHPHSSPPQPPTAVEQPILVPWDRVEQFIDRLAHDVRNGLNALELQLTFLGEISSDPETVAEVKRLRGTLSTVTRQLQGDQNRYGQAQSARPGIPSGRLLRGFTGAAGKDAT